MMKGVLRVQSVQALIAGAGLGCEMDLVGRGDVCGCRWRHDVPCAMWGHVGRPAPEHASAPPAAGDPSLSMVVDGHRHNQTDPQKELHRDTRFSPGGSSRVIMDGPGWDGGGVVWRPWWRGPGTWACI